MFYGCVHFGWCASFIQLVSSHQLRRGKVVRFYTAQFSQGFLELRWFGALRAVKQHDMLVLFPPFDSLCISGSY